MKKAKIVKILDEHKLCHATHFKNSFRDWDKYQELFYRRPQSVNKWHIFEVDSEAPTTMSFRRSNAESAESMKQDMKKRCTDVEEANARPQLLAINYPSHLGAPGIRPIKKKELSQKYRSLVPVEYRALDLYEDPTEEELAMLKEQEKDKKVAQPLRGKVRDVTPADQERTDIVDLDQPTFMRNRRAVGETSGALYRGVGRMALDDTDLDVPTFLRRKAD